MKDGKIILRDVGAILLTVGVATLFVNIIPLIFGEYEGITWITATVCVFLVLGGFFRLVGRGEDGETKIKHAMVIATLSWFFISLEYISQLCLLCENGLFPSS